MANNVTIGATGDVIWTYDRGGVEIPAQVPAGGASGTHGNFTATTTPTAHVAASSHRRYIIVQNQGAVNVYYGYTSSIGAGLSNYIAPGDSLLAEVVTAIYFAAASGTAVMTFDSVVNG